MAVIMKKMKKQSGFTLLELLMVAAIFSIVALIAVDLFFTVAKLQKRVTAIQRVESDARFTLEAMAREARMGMVDYDYYLANAIDLTTKTDILATRDQDSNLTIYKYQKDYQRAENDIILICAISPTEAQDKCDIAPGQPNNKWEQVTPRDIRITNLSFYITPAKDPFVFDDETGAYLSNTQPMVTLVLQSRSTSREQVSVVYTNFETTVTSRIYKR